MNEGNQYLCTESTSIQFKDDTRITEYIKDDNEVRHHMLDANYPYISDGDSTVIVLIEGLKRNTGVAQCATWDTSHYQRS